MATKILRPNAPGDECGITVQGGCSACPDHYTCVNEVTADDYSSYIADSPGEAIRQDLYNISDSGVGFGAISQIRVWFVSRAYPSYGRACAPLLKTHDIVYTGTPQSGPDDNFRAHSQDWTTNPYTEDPWTWDEINDLQIGLRLYADAGWDAYATQLYVEIFYTPAITKTLTETLSISESFKKSAKLLKSESMRIVESKVTDSSFQQNFVESLGIIDFKFLGITTFPSDSISFLESLIKQLNLYKSDSVPLSETFNILSLFEKTYAESFTLTDTQRSEIEKILTDSIGLTDIITLKKTFARVFGETLTLAESLVKLVSFEKTFTETEALVETFSKESGKTLSDSVSFLETLQKDLQLYSSDIFILDETEEWEFGKKIDDSLALTKILTKNVGLSKTDTISLSESVSRILETQRNFSETLALVESFAPVTIFKRVLIDVLTLTETISKFIERPLDDSFTLTDLIDILSSIGIYLTDSITFLPIAPKFIIKKSLSDILTLIEITYSEKVFQRIFFDTLTFVENLVKIFNLKKTESVSLSEVFKKISSLSLTETITLTEAFKKIIGFEKTDSLTISESFSKRIALQKTDSITLANVIALTIATKRRFYETLLLNESFTAERQIVLSDLLSLVEVIVQLSDIQLSKGETLILTESLERDKFSEKLLTDDFTLSDNIIKSIKIDLVDDFSLVETLIREYDITLQETLTIFELFAFTEKESIPQRVVLLTKDEKTYLSTKQNITHLFFK